MRVNNLNSDKRHNYAFLEKLMASNDMLNAII